MQMMLCLAAIWLVSVPTVPILLDRLTPGVRSGVRLAAWVATVATALAPLFMAPFIALATGHPVVAASVALLVVALGQQVQRRYRDNMRATRAHARGIRLIAHPADGLASQTTTVTIDSPTPLVYCVVGRPSVIVTTTAARNLLSPSELQAVLAHEEAHLRQHHAHLRAIVEAIATVLWWVPFLPHAAARITDATELCADVAATRRHHPHTLACALMALATAPAGALGAGLRGAAERLDQLLRQPDISNRRQLVIGLVALSPAITALAMALGCSACPGLPFMS